MTQNQPLWAATAPNGATTAEPRLDKATVLLSLTITSPGKRRKGRLDQIETDADRDMLSLSKELFDSEELKAIETLNGQLRQWIYKKALQVPSLFRAGVYVLPVAMVEDVDQRLQSHQVQLSDLAALFASAYPGLVAAARARLRSQFNPADYPQAQISPDGAVYVDQSAVQRLFRIEWRYVTLGAPDALQGISRDVWEREKAKTAAAWRQASDEIRDLLRAGFAELVEHMAERLTPGDDGKPKVFRDSLVANMAEYLETFPLRNVTNDSELAGLVDQAREMLQGVSPKDLRSNEALRDATARNMAEIKAALDAAATTRTRRYDLTQ